jgi:predicted deacylase
MFAAVRGLCSIIAISMVVLWWAPCRLVAENTHKVYFEGTDHELDVYTIRGRIQGPTLFLLGGIQGDEPGGYLAADLYADISLKKGVLIVVPRANFLSIVKNSRGVRGDMNRKFAKSAKSSDRDLRLVEVI